MRDWSKLVASMLRPARPHLDRCLRERDRHVLARREHHDKNARAIRECEQQIVDLREDVFAANDGFVGARMTELERTWRRLSRVDADAGMMELWTAVAPASWVDHKRWRGNTGTAQVDVAVLLAADVEGVEAAERAARTLSGRSRIAWRLEDASDTTPANAAAADTRLAEALVTAHATLGASEKLPIIVARAQTAENEVLEIARARFSDRPGLACGVGRVALAEYLIRAAALPAEHQERVDALCALWATGYVIAEMDEETVTLGIPPHSTAS